MIIDNLYKKVLINPAKKRYKELYIVSGYSSATFARKHLAELSDINADIKINLIIGMPSKRSDHQGYLSLKNDFNERFNAYYINNAPPVHSKVYAWCGENNISEGFSGSANYSQYGFFEKNQINQLITTTPNDIIRFYRTLLARTTSIENYVPLIDSDFRAPQIDGSIPAGTIKWIVPDKEVRISFLMKSGKLAPASGLNWGHSKAPKNRNRPNVLRDKNEAYLSIRTDATKEGFLPERKFTFTTIADDGYIMDCVVAQAGRKGIQTTYGNAILGEYIRKRIGATSGEFLTAEHLEKYGRTDFTLVKLDNETFRFDISI